ncbi:MAG: class I SAM-dependent methyltransferase [Pseudomonadota bacterium]
MTPEEQDAFFTVHHDLPREGPGEAADVYWALDLAGVFGRVRVLDAACGPGADLVTLAEALPWAQIDGVDQVPHFVEAAQTRVADFAPRVQASRGDMAKVTGPFDLIWCAGALYFLGVTQGLETWRDTLAPAGHVAFSEPVLLNSTPSKAVTTFWTDYPAITDLAGIETRVRAAGYRALGHRIIAGSPWQAYYEPLQARLDVLRAAAPDAALAAAIAENQTEIDLWRAASDDIAYALLVVAPE